MAQGGSKKQLKSIFLSSIHQNAGKTTVSLGLFCALQKRKFKTVFMKPVGQQFVPVGNLEIDKDSYLIGEVYRCKRKFKNMSPITVGRGFTEKYIANPQPKKLEEKILKAYASLKRSADVMIIEGTGHAGVGSVIDFSNADTAKLLGAKVVLISEGGIGKTIDEIMLNKALFDLRGVEVIGVIINKVLPEKYEKVSRVVRQGLANKGMKVLGVIPYQPLLSSPRVDQIKEALRANVLCGEKNIHRYVKDVIVAAMEPHNMVQHMEDGTLVLTSGDRIDNILLTISSHLVNDNRSFQVSGMILTGGLVPNKEIVGLLQRSGIPVLLCERDTYSVAAEIERMICKIQKTDAEKIREANRVVQKYVDVKTMINAF